MHDPNLGPLFICGGWICFSVCEGVVNYCLLFLFLFVSVLFSVLFPVSSWCLSAVVCVVVYGGEWLTYALCVVGWLLVWLLLSCVGSLFNSLY